MADPDSLDQRAGQLHAEHDYWEGVRRNAANELQQQRDAEAQEELKSRLSTAGFNLDQIAQELNRIERLREAVAQDPGRDGALKEEFAKQEREKVEAFQKEEQQKAEFQKEEQQKAEAFKKEEQQKTEAFEKELQEKESFEKQERETKEAFAEEAREKQEAFEKEERDKQEFEKQEIQKKEQSALDDLAKTADYIQDQVNSEWDYVDKQIQSELEYGVGQAVAAFAEAGFEIGMAIANPVSQKEAGQYLEQQNQGLRDLTSDEVFQGAPAEHKAMWLEEKFKDLQQAEQEKFGERKDDFNYRDNLQDNLAELQKIGMDAVQREQEIQDKVKADVEGIKRAEAETKERLEKNIPDKELLEEKRKQVEEIAKEREAQIRQKAEEERQKVWEKALEEQRILTDKATKTQEELARQEARERAEAERKAREAAERAAKALSLGF